MIRGKNNSLLSTAPLKPPGKKEKREEQKALHDKYPNYLTPEDRICQISHHIGQKRPGGDNIGPRKWPEQRKSVGGFKVLGKKIQHEMGKDQSKNEAGSFAEGRSLDLFSKMAARIPTVKDNPTANPRL